MRVLTYVVGVAGCFHKKCYQKTLRQKSCTVNIKWHISVFSMGKRISSKNKQIACSSTYLPSIDSRGSHCMQLQCCRNQGGQGAIVPSTIFDRKTKLNELLIFTIEPQSCFISVDPEFMLCFQYFKAHIHAS